LVGDLEVLEFMVVGREKLWPLFFAIVAIGALILLSAAFRDIELSSQGQPLPQPTAQEQEEFLAPERTDLVQYLYLVVFIAGATLMMLAFVYLLLSREAKKQALKQLLVLALVFGVLLLTQDRSEILPEQIEPPEPELPLVEAAPGGLGEAAPAVDREFSADSPTWLVWIVASVLALAVAGGLVSAGWFLWGRTRGPTDVLEQLAEEAQVALDALRAGADLQDTVLRCYRDMNRVLQLRKGIVRERAMTAREFESSLGEFGLPGEQVRQLTRLFEAVRYGAKLPQEYEARLAMDCLSAIVQACRSAP
jgi:hypothetical protein